MRKVYLTLTIALQLVRQPALAGGVAGDSDRDLELSLYCGQRADVEDTEVQGAKWLTPDSARLTARAILLMDDGASVAECLKGATCAVSFDGGTPIAADLVGWVVEDSK